MPGSMLHHMVISKLAEAPQSGYGLCSSIEKCTGRRPSYGSMYPYLEKLATEGMVSVKEDGKKKIYSLTKEGKQLADEMQEKKHKLMEKMQPDMLAMAELMGIDPRPMMSILGKVKKGEQPLGGVSANMFTFRNTIFEMAQKGSLEKHEKEINAMLKENLKQLRRMQ